MELLSDVLLFITFIPKEEISIKIKYILSIHYFSTFKKPSCDETIKYKELIIYYFTNIISKNYINNILPNKRILYLKIIYEHYGWFNSNKLLFDELVVRHTDIIKSQKNQEKILLDNNWKNENKDSLKIIYDYYNIINLPVDNSPMAKSMIAKTIMAKKQLQFNTLLSVSNKYYSYEFDVNVISKKRKQESFEEVHDNKIIKL
jgi:hypothetical protein